jgi:hypothetical protein
MPGQGISSSILSARLILDGKMEVRQDLRPTDLMAAEIAGGGKILKIFVVSKNFSRFRGELQIVSPLLEGLHNGQEFLVIDLVVHLCWEKCPGIKSNRMESSFIIILAADNS